jgi:hypothetical protein
MLETRCVPSTVTNLLDAGPGSLRQAILDTPAGGTVDFQPGLTGTIVLTTGELAINRDLTIAGPGATVITVSGNHASRVFDIAASTVALSGLTVADGSAIGTLGGGILNAGTLTVTNSILSGNSAAAGGGIFNNGMLTITGATVSGNAAGVLGGGIDNNGGRTVFLTQSTLSGNSASAGGGIFNSGSLTVSSCSLGDNSAGQGGGILNSNLGTLTITGSTFSGNSASGNSADGGGIDNQGTLTSPTRPLAATPPVLLAAASTTRAR